MSGKLNEFVIYLSNLLFSLSEGLSISLDHLTGFLIGIAMAALIFSSLGRAAYSVFRPLRAVFRPFASMLRRMRLLPRVVAKTKPVRGAVIGARAAVRGAPAHFTETEWALSQPDFTNDAVTSDSDGSRISAELFDFKVIRQHIFRDGLLFKSMDFSPSYLPNDLTNQFTAEIADRFEKEATRFFGQRVNFDVNERALYEDAEGAIFVDMFRNTDRRAFFALDQMRRTINGNAATLVVSLFLVLAGPLLYWQFYLQADGNATWPVVVSMLISATVMLSIQNLGYANQQRQNTREMSAFLGRYLDRLSDRYRETSAAATRVIQGDVRDAKVLAAEAQKWLKIMMWLPFRAFFIESFVRGVSFQIRRNAGYYMFLAYALALCMLVASYGISLNQSAVKIGLVLAIGYTLLVAAYIYCIRKKVVLTELDQIRWLGYDNLNVGKQMDEVIGKYAAEIAKWNGRFDR